MPNMPGPTGHLYLVRGTGRQSMRLELNFGVIGCAAAERAGPYGVHMSKVAVPVGIVCDQN